ncbi:MAG: hypothetical protein LIO53_02000 [Oscillospiraceae bacterium]|nr:hypothetical protein [Oscillospiraceae bacterium]
MMKLTFAVLLTSAVIFGGRGIKRLWHKWRMRRNDRYREKLEKSSMRHTSASLPRKWQR